MPAARPAFFNSRRGSRTAGQAVNIELTTVSPPLTALLPRFQADVVAGNIEAARVVAETPGLKQYAVIDPRRRETYAYPDETLKQPQCVGINLH